MTFRDGEVVHLRSGGPRMTVEGHDDELVQCVWFEGTEQKRSTFKETTLQTWVQPTQVSAARTRYDPFNH